MSFDDIRESAAMAVSTVRANKLRSALTILGVGIGVVTLTFMVSIIQGLNKAFAEQIESLGSNTIFVSKFDPSFGRPPNNEELHRKDITFEDAVAIRVESADSIDSVAPIRRSTASVSRTRSNGTGFLHLSRRLQAGERVPVMPSLADQLLACRLVREVESDSAVTDLDAECDDDF